MTVKKSPFLSFGFSLLFALIAMLLCDQASIGQTPQDRLVPENYASPAAALAAANPGDTIVLSVGEYFTNLVITKPITIRGAIFGAGNNARLLAAQGGDPIIQVRSAGVRIQSLEFSRGIVGVEGLSQASELNITNCIFNDIFGDAIRCTGNREVAITGSMINNSEGRGVFLNGVDGFFLSNNLTVNSGGAAYEIVANRGLVDSCGAISNDLSGFFIEGSDIGVLGCSSLSNSGIGFLFVNTERFGFMDNTALLNGRFGVLSVGVEDALFADNSVMRNGDIGVLFDNSRRTALQSNLITNNSGVGAYYSPSTSDNFAGGNDFMSNGFDVGVVDEGSNFVED